MKRLLPKSLIGQIALAIGLVLLVLQAVNFISIRNEQQQRAQAQLEGPVMSRYVGSIGRLLAREREGAEGGRRARVAFGAQSNVSAEQSDAGLAERLRETAAANAFELRDARAALSDDVPPAIERERDRGRGFGDNGENRAERFRSLLLSVQLPDGRWINGQLPILRPSMGPFWRLAAGTLLLYLVLLGAVIFVIRRLVSPLRDLTGAAQRFNGHGEIPQVSPRGPTDIHRAIEAFNAMGARVHGLLEEKDRMLGAIGHDLRTPLASLRIRTESVEPAEERERMIATIEEMAGMLEDALSLARSGRSQEKPRALDIAALADVLVEEMRELGHSVTLFDSARAVACVRPNLLRGAIRNLIENAVKYAGSAEVAVGRDGNRVTIEVLDRGPGIPDDQLAGVQEAFVRLEASRSRETGGSGLGITLARAAAQLHHGGLMLDNRDGGGLRALLWLPRDSKLS